MRGGEGSGSDTPRKTQAAQAKEDQSRGGEGSGSDTPLADQPMEVSESPDIMTPLPDIYHTSMASPGGESQTDWLDPATRLPVEGTTEPSQAVGPTTTEADTASGKLPMPAMESKWQPTKTG